MSKCRVWTVTSCAKIDWENLQLPSKSALKSRPNRKRLRRREKPKNAAESPASGARYVRQPLHWPKPSLSKLNKPWKTNLCTKVKITLGLCSRPFVSYESVKLLLQATRCNFFEASSRSLNQSCYIPYPYLWTCKPLPNRLFSRGNIPYSSHYYSIQKEINQTIRYYNQHEAYDQKQHGKYSLLPND